MYGHRTEADNAILSAKKFVMSPKFFEYLKNALEVVSTVYEVLGLVVNLTTSPNTRNSTTSEITHFSGI